MNSLSVDPLTSVTKQGDGAGRTFLKALLLASTLLGGTLATQPADARLLITTTGIIASGSETGGLFGLPVAMTSLAGDSYTLIVEYDGLGPKYFNEGDGTLAYDIETLGDPGSVPAIGSVTAIVNGQSLTTPLTNSLGSFLFEDSFDFNASNQGFNGTSTGAFVNVSQSLGCSDPCVPYADLMQPFSHVLSALS